MLVIQPQSVGTHSHSDTLHHAPPLFSRLTFVCQTERPAGPDGTNVAGNERGQGVCRAWSEDLPAGLLQGPTTYKPNLTDITFAPKLQTHI